MSKIHGNTIIYGFKNTAFLPETSEGTFRWFLDASVRDKALEALRVAARAKGLSKSASLSGIVACEERWGTLRDEVKLRQVVGADLERALTTHQMGVLKRGA